MWAEAKGVGFIGRYAPSPFPTNFTTLARTLFLLLSATLRCVFACISTRRQAVKEAEFIYKYSPPEADKVKPFRTENYKILFICPHSSPINYTLIFMPARENWNTCPWEICTNARFAAKRNASRTWRLCGLPVFSQGEKSIISEPIGRVFNRRSQGIVRLYNSIQTLCYIVVYNTC